MTFVITDWESALATLEILAVGLALGALCWWIGNLLRDTPFQCRPPQLAVGRRHCYRPPVLCRRALRLDGVRLTDKPGGL
jgi:hypothetical protein